MFLRLLRILLQIPVMAGLTLLCGCDDYVPPAEPQAVVEGWFGSGGYPEVAFTTTMAPGGVDNLRDALIIWGKVTVSDGERTVVLTGGRAQGYMPPYHYYTSEMRGVPGRVYTLTAEYGDFHATASVRMPSPTPIDSVCVRPVEGNDTLRSVTLYFTAPEDVPAYYYLSVKEPRRRQRPYPSMLGCVEARRKGERVAVPVLRSKRIDNRKDFESSPCRGDTLVVSLNRVDKDTYSFWMQYTEMTMLGSNVFLGSATPLEGNLRGALGIWSVQGTDTRVVIVP